jgi:Pyruvate/2-oxoacid:ferredoxin oxidoreductase delta subunit
MNVVMAGEDGVAIDACIAKIIGLQPLDVLVTKVAHEVGMGEADLSRVEIVGDALDGFIIKDFKLPQTTPLKMIPRSVLNSLASLIRFKPYIDSRICNRCNLCKVTCPVNAIETGEKRCEIDYQRCVRCLCCHEVCPYRAISIKRNMLTKMVWG